MNSFKMAWMLFKNNFKLYKFYFAVLTFAASIYYNFLAVNFNPYISVLNEQYTFARIASQLCSCILFFTLLFFMVHGNNFFYKQRYKELGTYMLMGIPSTKIGGVFAIESMILGSLSVIAGLPIGILFSKLFFMLLSQTMILKVQIPFYLSAKAMVLLLLVFLSIIILLGFKNYWTVRRSRLIEILNASKKEQMMPRLKVIRGILGVVSIVLGYILAMNVMKWKIDFMSAMLAIPLLVCVGTYLFFGSFLSLVLARCIRNKKLIYKGSRLISFSNTLFRLGTHYRSFAMTAVLSASALTAFCSGLALKYFAEHNILLEAPYSISYMNQDEITHNKIKGLISQSSHKLTAEHETRFIRTNISYKNRGIEVKEDCLVTSYSEMKKSLEVIKPNHYQKILQQIKPLDNEVVSVLHSKLIFSGINRAGNIYTIRGNDYKLKEETKLPFIGEMPKIGGFEVYIVTDKEYTKLRKDKQEMILTNMNITEQEKSTELVRDIAGIMKNPADNLHSYVGEYEYKYYAIGAFYFFGLVMAIVFMIAAFSTIYFKILSDALLDKTQYKMLMKIGISKEEITKSIYTQVGMAFILPAALGILHSVMAIKALEAFMHSKFDEVVLFGVSVFIVIMGAFYMLISKKYRDMIYEGEVRR